MKSSKIVSTSEPFRYFVLFAIVQVITILIAETTKYIAEYTIGKAVSYVKEENAQNSPAMSKGVNQKNFMSLPASIPITIEQIIPNRRGLPERHW